MELGKLVTNARELAGMSKAELSRRTRVHLRHIGRIERGDVENPRMDTIEALAKAFGLTSSGFLSGRKPRLKRKAEPA